MLLFFNFIYHKDADKSVFTDTPSLPKKKRKEIMIKKMRWEQGRHKNNISKFLHEEYLRLQETVLMSTQMVRLIAYFDRDESHTTLSSYSSCYKGFACTCANILYSKINKKI